MFKPNDKVVCISIEKRIFNDYSVSSPWQCLKLNETYTVSKVYEKSITLVELSDLYSHGVWRFKTIRELRKEKLNKIANEI